MSDVSKLLRCHDIFVRFFPLCVLDVPIVHISSASFSNTVIWTLNFLLNRDNYNHSLKSKWLNNVSQLNINFRVTVRKIFVLLSFNKYVWKKSQVKEMFEQHVSSLLFTSKIKKKYIVSSVIAVNCVALFKLVVYLFCIIQLIKKWIVTFWQKGNISRF